MEDPKYFPFYTEKEIMGMIELTPLSKEMIDELHLNQHDLWVVKMDDEIYGPFEGISLQEYANDHEDTFEKAEATRVENHDWQPFFSHALFQRRTPKIIKHSDHKFGGPFWITNHGIKAGPIDKEELVKRIENRTIGLTDLISSDDGHSWIKVYEIPDLDRRSLQLNLPSSPKENDFREARIQLLEKLEINSSRHKTSDELAQMTHEATGAILPFIKDIPIERHDGPRFDKELKFKVAGSFVAILLLLVAIPTFLTLKDSSGTLSVVEEGETEKTVSATENVEYPSPKSTRQRSPASSAKRFEKKTPRFNKTENELNEIKHHTPIYRDDLPVEPDEPNYRDENEVADSGPNESTVDENPITDEFQENENRAPSSFEESLVTQPNRRNKANNPEETELSVEDVMSGSDSPEIEEVSDF